MSTTTMTTTKITNAYKSHGHDVNHDAHFEWQGNVGHTNAPQTNSNNLIGIQNYNDADDKETSKFTSILSQLRLNTDSHKTLLPASFITAGAQHVSKNNPNWMVDGGGTDHSIKRPGTSLPPSPPSPPLPLPQQKQPLGYMANLKQHQQQQQHQHHQQKQQKQPQQKQQTAGVMMFRARDASSSVATTTTGCTSATIPEARAMRTNSKRGIAGLSKRLEMENRCRTVGTMPYPTYIEYMRLYQIPNYTVENNDNLAHNYTDMLDFVENLYETVDFRVLATQNLQAINKDINDKLAIKFGVNVNWFYTLVC